MNKFAKTLVALLIFPIVALFSGCQPQPAESAYDIALRHGFVGTEEEWLASLKGEDGDSVTIDISDDGYWIINGTKTTTKAVGEDGEYAGQGLSAYEIALLEGFEGSRAEWVASLVGEKGDKGDKGDAGQDGEDGIDGASADNVVTAVTNNCITSVVAIESKFQYTYNYSYGYGTGVIVEDDKTNGTAYIMTNHHVVFDADSVTTDGYAKTINVYLYGQEYKDYAIAAQLIGASMTYDIAVLKITSSIYAESIAKPAEFAPSIDVVAGDDAIVIGNADAEGIGVTSGIISKDSVDVVMQPTLKNGSTTTITYRSLRTDAAVNGGNSGGPMFNKNGKVIGIINIKTESADIDNMAYAIPSDIALKVYYNIVDNYTYKKVYLVQTGLEYAIASSTAYYDESTSRVRISEVAKISSIDSGSAAIGKLQVGDIVNSITYEGSSHTITRAFELVDYEIDFRTGMQVTYHITRGTEQKSITITYSSAATVI